MRASLLPVSPDRAPLCRAALGRTGNYLNSIGTGAGPMNGCAADEWYVLTWAYDDSGDADDDGDVATLAGGYEFFFLIP